MGYMTIGLHKLKHYLSINIFDIILDYKTQ